MGDFLTFLLKASIIMSFIFAAVASFIIFLNVIVSALTIDFNTSVIQDIFGLVAMWLPFNISGVVYWLLVAASMFITYRLAMVAYTWINRFIGLTS